MTTLAIAALAALAAATPDARAAATPAPASPPADGVGGPYEPVAEAILVEAPAAQAPRARWTIAPDSGLARRYGGEERYRPRNRIIVKF